MKFGHRALIVCTAIFTLALLGTGTYASQIHRIRQGDNLWDLAKHYKVSVSKITSANKISENKTLQIGDKIIIPTKEKPHAKAQHSKDKSKISDKAIARFGPRVAQQIEIEEAAEKTGQDRPGEIVRTALAYRGARYVRGGTGRRGFDCSGFTRHIYRKFGVSLPHSSRAQAGCGKSISRSELKSGDILLFHTYRRGVSHVGIYIGEGKFIHASTPRHGVIISSLNERYYASRYIGARRIIREEKPEG